MSGDPIKQRAASWVFNALSGVAMTVAIGVFVWAWNLNTQITAYEIRLSAIEARAVENANRGMASERALIEIRGELKLFNQNAASLEKALEKVVTRLESSQ